MARFIDRLPIAAEERRLNVAGGATIAAKALQPIVWISVAPPQVIDLPSSALRFPAVLDTGFNQTLLIQDRHLLDWAASIPPDCKSTPVNL